MTSPEQTGPAKLDIYARPFVPQALRNVNEGTANIIPCAPVRWIDFGKYTSSFAGTDFLQADGARLIPNKLTASPEQKGENRDDDRVTSLDSTGLEQAAGPQRCENSGRTLHSPLVYHQHFLTALVDEAASQQSECEDHALYRVSIVRANPELDPRPSVYTLNVPGLRELSLRIEIGDVVQLRQIRFDQRAEIIFGSVSKNQDGTPIDLPRKHDSQHNSVVWSIDRLNENLSLRIDNLSPRSMLFNVRFTTQAGRFKGMYNAVITAQNALVASDESWMRSMLFPQDSDGYYQKTLNKTEHGLNLCDDQLNYEQARAVSTVVNELYGPVPFIISGPPGTGKTKTTVELALQLLAKDSAAHLLMCAPSDPAADTLIERLSKRLKPAQLLRINAPSRNFPEVPMAVLPYCCIDDGMFSLPPFAELMKKRVVVTTCRDADLLVRARVTNNDLSSLHHNLHTAIHPFSPPPPPPQNLHWTALLVDEAAQATEPEALIPLIIVNSPSNHAIPDTSLPKVILAGDHHQLGPRTACKDHAISTSLFERLLSRPFYAAHPLARSRQSNGVMRPLTQEMLPILRPAFANLIRNYRSHPAILAVPSALFYNDTLEPEAPLSATASLASWTGWKGRAWPVLFSATTAPDEIERDGGGWYNVGETELACAYAASLLQTQLVEARDVCIMSPFRAQVKVLRKFARARGLGGVNIGPLEAFQGLEKRVVILCTTRTRDRFLEQDIAKGLGVIHEARRFNVAVTRAMHGLIVIGNPSLLSKDESWRAFLDFCGRNGLWEDKERNAGQSTAGTVEGQGKAISRLERRLIQSELENGETDGEGLSKGIRRLGLVREDAEDAVWRDGVAAEMVVRSETKDPKDEEHKEAGGR